jgi:hypothetical protein
LHDQQLTVKVFRDLFSMSAGHLDDLLDTRIAPFGSTNLAITVAFQNSRTARYIPSERIRPAG